MQQNDTGDDLDIKGNLEKVAGDISVSAKAAGRSPTEIGLLAVSKMQSQEKIQAALEAGHRMFGENRVQEAMSKWAMIRKSFPDLQLHLIGSLQRNKVSDAVAIFDVIESLDRPKLALALSREQKRTGRNLSYFVQVNTGNETQKGGVDPLKVEDFVTSCRSEYNLNVVGLMCIPPVEEEPSLHFSLLFDLARRCSLAKLSMGMSKDYSVAIQFGATHVRLGTAVFGARSPN